MLSKFPEDYDDPTRYTKSGNVERYYNRGWCFCEASWSSLVKSFAKVLDLSLHSGTPTSWEELGAPKSE
jgi:hypothetical protein